MTDVTTPEGLADFADSLERCWLEGRMAGMIAGLRAIAAADATMKAAVEKDRKRASAKTDGNVIAVNFGSAGAS